LRREAAAKAEAERVAELNRPKSAERLRLEELLDQLESDRSFIVGLGYELLDKGNEILIQGKWSIISIHVNVGRLQVSKLAVMGVLAGEKAKKKAAPQEAPPLRSAMTVDDDSTQWLDTAKEAKALIARYLAEATYRNDSVA
jgi:hypothetical protein